MHKLLPYTLALSVLMCCILNIRLQLPDVFEGGEEFTLIIESFSKEISDTFDIPVKIPAENNVTSHYLNGCEGGFNFSS